jgi:hypothetical protein
MVSSFRLCLVTALLHAAIEQTAYTITGLPMASVMVIRLPRIENPRIRDLSVLGRWCMVVISYIAFEIGNAVHQSRQI